MPSDREIEAARDSIRELSGGHSLKSISGDYLWQTKNPINITKALEAAEQSRQDMHTELVEALRACIGVIVEYTEYEHSGDPWEEDARAMGEMSIDDFKQEGKLQDVIDLLLKATKEG